MIPEPNPASSFEAATIEHFRPLADRLTLRFMRYHDHFFMMFAADIAARIEFFEPRSSGGYDVCVGIAQRQESEQNRPEEYGLGWFTKYLNIAGMPRDRITSVADIPRRVQALSEITECVLGKVFSARSEFWPPFYAFVRTEIAKVPEPSWMQNYKKK